MSVTSERSSTRTKGQIVLIQLIFHSFTLYNGASMAGWLAGVRLPAAGQARLGQEDSSWGYETSGKPGQGCINACNQRYLFTERCLHKFSSGKTEQCKRYCFRERHFFLSHRLLPSLPLLQTDCKFLLLLPRYHALVMICSPSESQI